jgi:hypothetical protein
MLPLDQSETWRCVAILAPSSLSLGSEWYLGGGFAARVEAGLHGGSCWSVPVSLSWYPTQSITLTYTLDPLWGRLIPSLSLRP